MNLDDLRKFLDDKEAERVESEANRINALTEEHNRRDIERQRNSSESQRIKKENQNIRERIVAALIRTGETIWGNGNFIIYCNGELIFKDGAATAVSKLDSFGKGKEGQRRLPYLLRPKSFPFSAPPLKNGFCVVTDDIVEPRQLRVEACIIEKKWEYVTKTGATQGDVEGNDYTVLEQYESWPLLAADEYFTSILHQTAPFDMNQSNIESFFAWVIKQQA